MGINKAEAIILHGRKQGETSKVLTVYSREFGKMSVMAKGSRGVKSKYLGALEPFNHVALVFYQKEGRQMQYLSDAAIVAPFTSLHAQLGKMALAAVACEIVDKNEEDDHAHPELFHLLLDTLRALETGQLGLRNIIRAFQLQYIAMSGFEPELEHCHFCQKTAVDEMNFFSIERGLYNCNDCGKISEAGLPVSGYVLELLRWLGKTPVLHAAQAQVAKTVGEEIDAILLNYMRIHIESLSHLQSIKYLKKLQAELQS